MMDRRVFMKLAAGTVAYVAGGVLYCPNNFLGHRLGNAMERHAIAVAEDEVAKGSSVTEE